MRKLFRSLKTDFFLYAALFLLAFIPLYPKLPLLDVVHTWVYVRFEDFLVAVAVGIFTVVSLKRRKLPDSQLALPIFVYWLIGGISLIQALIFIFPHLNNVYPYLGILHYARRIEYMSLFFLAYEAFLRRPAFKALIAVLTGTYLTAILYATGQKFLGWPAFLTMNEEFAKGTPLRLPPTARIPSTFGGHYDFAAFLVFLIPVMASMMFGVKKRWQKVMFLVLALAGLQGLLFTASRISFGVYLVAICVMFLWHKKPLYIIPAVIVSMIMLNLTSGASDRFYKTFRYSDVIVDLSTGQPVGTLDKLQGTSALAQRPESPAEEQLPTGSGFINLPGSGAGNGKGVTSIELFKTADVAGAKGDIATISGSFLISKALVYDISITTRFQAEWPKAIEAFKRNILLGSGYSVLSVASDGDYHRMLGETGLLGAVSFLGIFIMAFAVFRRAFPKLSEPERSFAIGVFAGLTGLLVNAVLIDVFEASKVAFTLWIVLGATMAIITDRVNVKLPYPELLRKVFLNRPAYLVYLFVILLLVYSKVFSVYFIGDDFTWLRWAASDSVRAIPGYFTNAQGFFYRPVPKLWYLMLFTVFWLKPELYHLASVGLVFIAVFAVWRILVLSKVHPLLAWLMALWFGVLSVHHENIYWISGQSSLLAGALFALAVLLLAESGRLRGRVGSLFVTGSVVSLFLSMLSYEGMILAPAVYWLVAAVIYRKRRGYLAVLLLIPAYWLLRSHAGAITGGGDYTIKLAKLPVNIAVNSVGYLATLATGPQAVVFFNAQRALYRTYLVPALGAVAALAAGAAFVVTTRRKQLRAYRDAGVWAAGAVLLAAPYAALGGMAERYAYVPSFAAAIGLGLTVWRLVSSRKSRYALVTAAVLIAGHAAYQAYEFRAVGNDWVFAGNVVENTLLAIKKDTFPPKDRKVFYFIGLPTRYGRAWIFPTGITDAIWHMYRLSPFEVHSADSLEDAFGVTVRNGTQVVYIFEGYEIKRGIHEVHITRQPEQNQ